MSTLYIISDDGKLTKEEEHLCLHKTDGTHERILLFQTDSIVLAGSISITGDALRFISRKQIPLIFVSKNGMFNSRLDYSASKNVFLHRQQFKLNESSQSLSIAKAIVCGKIKNQLTFIQRIKRKAENAEDLCTITETLKQLMEDAENTASKESLRGYEGLAAKHYFRAVAFNIEPEWADFKTRSQHPPKTNVNAVLSFLYTMLSHKVRCAIELQGLDATIGTMHELTYGKEMLVYDLMEEFRVPVCDMVCCALFNLNILHEEDFRQAAFDSENDDFPLQEGEPQETGILLTRDGMYKVSL